MAERKEAGHEPAGNEKRPGDLERMRESELRYRTLVEGSPELVFITDLSSRMLYANDALFEQTGYTVADFQMTQSENRLIHPDDAGRVASFIAEFLASEKKFSGRLENRFLARSGRVLWYSTVIAKTTYEGAPALQFATYNITERKLAEQERDRLLAQERQARLEAERSLRVRDDFLAIASHELRTPITPVKLYLQVLARHLEEVQPESFPKISTLRQGLEITTREVDRLARLIEDLLDVSRITSGQLALKRERFALAELVEAVARRFEGELARFKCELRWREREGIEGNWDRARLEQVVANLLVNAMKYGSGKPIELTVRGGGPGLALLSIRDQGFGIEPGDQARIFERFERVAPIQSYGGLGLGLFIAREIVVAHGGRIEVESAKGEGAQFSVWLPA